MIVTFCGHKNISNEYELERWLCKTLQQLICEGADMFYLGGIGSYDLMVLRILQKLKEIHPHLQIILVLPYLNRPYDLAQYDSSVCPPLEKTPPKYAISKRNEWMIAQSDVVVAYVQHEWGGAAASLKTAKQKKKRIYLFPTQDSFDREKNHNLAAFGDQEPFL